MRTRLLIGMFCTGGIAFAGCAGKSDSDSGGITASADDGNDDGDDDDDGDAGAGDDNDDGATGADGPETDKQQTVGEPMWSQAATVIFPAVLDPVAAGSDESTDNAPENHENWPDKDA